MGLVPPDVLIGLNHDFLIIFCMFSLQPFPWPCEPEPDHHWQYWRIIWWYHHQIISFSMTRVFLQSSLLLDTSYPQGFPSNSRLQQKLPTIDGTPKDVMGLAAILIRWRYLMFGFSQPYPVASGSGFAAFLCNSRFSGRACRVAGEGWSPKDPQLVRFAS